MSKHELSDDEYNVYHSGASKKSIMSEFAICHVVPHGNVNSIQNDKIPLL